MAIFSFLARLGLDPAESQAGIKKAESAAHGMANHVGGMFASVGSRLAGVFSVAGIAAASKMAFDAVKNRANEIADLADTLGTSTDEAQKLEKAAAHTTVSMDTLTGAFARVSKFQADYAEGAKEATELAKRLGISSAQALSLTPSELFVKATDNVNAGLASQAALFDLLGKKTKDMQRVAAELQTMGPVKLMSEEDIRAMEKFSDNWSAWWKEQKASAAPAASAVAEFSNQAFERSKRSGGSVGGEMLSEIVGSAFQYYLGDIGKSFNGGVGIGGAFDRTRGEVSGAALPLSAALEERASRRSRAAASDDWQDKIPSLLEQSAKNTKDMADTLKRLEAK